jgi:hypothetical protein
MQTPVETCTESQSPEKAQRAFQLIKPWITREEMHSLVSKQSSMSWEEKVPQINRSLGLPQGSP